MLVGVDDVAVGDAHPATVTGREKSTMCTKACDGPTRSASIWNPAAMSGRSRTLPLVITASQPRPLWMLLLTSPQNEP